MATQLQPGQQAPDFAVTDVNGTAVSLDDYTSGFVLVAFMRYAGCPWCNLAIHRLAMEAKLLGDNHCKIIVFVQSSKENIIKNIHDQHSVKPPFPIIADPHKKLYSEYGVSSSIIKSTARAIRDIPDWVHAVKDLGFAQKNIDGDLFMVPAMFLIHAKDKTIIQAIYGPDLFDHQTFTSIYESLIFED